MSKKEKEKKVKAVSSELTYEQATENFEAAKAARQKARKAVEKLATDKGLNGKADHSKNEDKAFVKEYKPLRQVWLDAKAAEAEAEAAMKKLKPSSARNSKYDYPEDVVTAEDKKKHRAKMRAAANKKEKGETPAKPAKDKKAKKAEAAVEEAPAKKKKSKEALVEEPAPKKKKKKAVSADED